MTVDEFKNQIITEDPFDLASAYLASPTVCAFPEASGYSHFKEKVLRFLPDSEHVAIVGSGGWGYSLNPEKFLLPFRPKSDIDVAVISNRYFFETWGTMREIHRKKWYTLEADARSRLRRNGENVYSGFVCPSWIPQFNHLSVYTFKSMLNKLSGKDVGYRDVKMLFFKDMTEAIDYYTRGFSEACRRINK